MHDPVKFPGFRESCTENLSGTGSAEGAAGLPEIRGGLYLSCAEIVRILTSLVARLLHSRICRI
jgi:hypothetical protein